jgi:peptide deformylase
MAILPIYTEPHPILKKKAAPVQGVDDALRTLVDDMAETMYLAPGVGLAAPQVGHAIRLLVADWSQHTDEEGETHRGDLVALINPTLVAGTGEVSIEEGCLSVPDFTLEVPRYQHIVVRTLNLEGEEVELELEDFAAIVVQHEMDHLEGVTLLDRVSRLRKKMYLKRRKKQADRDEQASAT